MDILCRSPCLAPHTFVTCCDLLCRHTFSCSYIQHWDLPFPIPSAAHQCSGLWPATPIPAYPATTPTSGLSKPHYLSSLFLTLHHPTGNACGHWDHHRRAHSHLSTFLDHLCLLDYLPVNCPPSKYCLISILEVSFGFILFSAGSGHSVHLSQCPGGRCSLWTITTCNYHVLSWLLF